MSTSKTASDRILRCDMEQIIRAAFEGGDYTHGCEWAQPGSCPCHDQEGRSCLLPPEEGGCQGYPVEVDTPEEHQVTAEILVSALPVPGDDGTLDVMQAAVSVIDVIESRLTHPYTLRRDRLRARLTEEAERYEGAGLTADVPVLAVRCAWCGNQIPASRGPLARFCKNSHRVMAAKKKRAVREANEAVPAGR